MVPTGQGHCRGYIDREELAILRTEDSLRASALEAQKTGEKILGIYGQSVFSYFPEFSFIKVS